MKNFSDLLATETDIEVRIRLRAISDNGDPRCRVIVNKDTLYDSWMSGPVDLVSHVALTDHILISIEMSGKNYSADRETAVIIESLSIDGFDIIPRFAHLGHYENERGISGSTSYLGFNGSWMLDIPEPFYRWRHRITGHGWLLDPI
jgi:hypothetical protein